MESSSTNQQDIDLQQTQQQAQISGVSADDKVNEIDSKLEDLNLGDGKQSTDEEQKKYVAIEEEVKNNNYNNDLNPNRIIDLTELDNQQERNGNHDDDSEFKDAVCEIVKDLDKAKKLKEEANEDFKQERYDQCIRLYDQAILLCPDEETTDLAIFYNNKGICYSKMKDNKEAKKQFSKAIEIKADYVKPRALRMKIHRDEDEFDQALEDAKKIQEIEPSYPGIHRTVMELDVLQKEKFEKMKNEVLGNLKSFGNTILGKFGMSLDNFKLNQNSDGTYNVNYQNQ
eukprot:403331017